VAGRSRPAELLRNLLKDGRVTLEALSAQAPDLLSNLVPVWAVSPLVLPAVVPEAHRFDAVVILDAESTSLQAALPALARAHQVVAFGDGQTASPRAFSVSVERVARGEEQQPPLQSAFDALSRVLPRHRLTVSYRAVAAASTTTSSNGCPMGIASPGWTAHWWWTTSRTGPDCRGPTASNP
jgi:hypothetical protein